jgi:hypothetical protein
LDRHQTWALYNIFISMYKYTYQGHTWAAAWPTSRTPWTPRSWATSRYLLLDRHQTWALYTISISMYKYTYQGHTWAAVWPTSRTPWTPRSWATSRYLLMATSYSVDPLPSIERLHREGETDSS